MYWGRAILLAYLAAGNLFAADPLAIPSNKTIEQDRIQNLEKDLTELEQKISSQKAQLKLLKENISGNFDSDARLVIEQNYDRMGNYKILESRYYLDDREIVSSRALGTGKALFDSFLAEGKHKIRIEQIASQNNKVFTYMNAEKYRLHGEVEVNLEPGKTTFLTVNIFSKQGKEPLDMSYDVKNVAHASSASIIPVSQTPHLLPGTTTTDTVVVIVASKDLLDKFALNSSELNLDGSKLKLLDTLADLKTGKLLYQGQIKPGKHRLKSVLELSSKEQARFKVKFDSEFVAQPGFKNTILLKRNSEIKAEQEKL